ncbi:hypothetical protein CDL15_Pgr003289 [Punica granatum]|uniref:Uncharacterized protein n=1 Tax=Punica granatum TaxID=22663 RepID=A0A218X2S7_PUNGR|nr:hypothetical protein CDL15_Pgr003289 [Punica granatum]
MSSEFNQLKQKRCALSSKNVNRSLPTTDVLLKGRVLLPGGVKGNLNYDGTGSVQRKEVEIGLIFAATPEVGIRLGS